MNKKDLKNLIKPIVKECIHEVLLSEGILSGVISEVMKGTQQAATIVEEVKPAEAKSTNEIFRERTRRQSPKNNRTAEARNMLNSALGSDAYNGINLFEGTEPLKAGGNPGATAQPQGALGGIESDDPGVDISGIMNIAGNSWQKFK